MLKLFPKFETSIKMISKLSMSKIKLFESKKVRSHWDNKNERWYFSVIEVIAILKEVASQNVIGEILNENYQKNDFSCSEKSYN